MRDRGGHGSARGCRGAREYCYGRLPACAGRVRKGPECAEGREGELCRRFGHGGFPSSLVVEYILTVSLSSVRARAVQRVPVRCPSSSPRLCLVILSCHSVPHLCIIHIVANDYRSPSTSVALRDGVRMPGYLPTRTSPEEILQPVHLPPHPRRSPPTPAAQDSTLGAHKHCGRTSPALIHSELPPSHSIRSGIRTIHPPLSRPAPSQPSPISAPRSTSAQADPSPSRPATAPLPTVHSIPRLPFPPSPSPAYYLVA